MIKHVVAFNLVGQSPEQEAAMLAGCGALLGVIPELKAFSMGRNISPRDDKFTHCLVTEFEDMEAMKRYLVHPDHEAVVETYIAPYVQSRMIVDYVMEG